MNDDEWVDSYDAANLILDFNETIWFKNIKYKN